MAAVADTFAQFRKTLNKGFLNDRAGIAWQTTLGGQMDASFNRIVEAVNSRFPSYCASDGLLFIGAERNLEQGFNESESDYRGILRSAWAVWAQAGTADSHSFNLGRLGFQKVIIKRRRDLSGLPPAGLGPYVDAFTRDVWAQFDIICQKPMPWSATYWGTGSWGTGSWGTTATPAQLEQVKRFARTFRAAHDTPMWLHLQFGPGQIWGLGAWGTGVWAATPGLISILIGEPHWTQRGLL